MYIFALHRSSVSAFKIYQYLIVYLYLKLMLNKPFLSLILYWAWHCSCTSWLKSLLGGHVGDACRKCCAPAQMVKKITWRAQKTEYSLPITQRERVSNHDSTYSNQKQPWLHIQQQKETMTTHTATKSKATSSLFPNEMVTMPDRTHQIQQ